MSLNSVIDNLEELIRKLPDATLDNLDASAADGTALLVQRLQEKGVNAEGQPWRPYSPAYQDFKEQAGYYTGKVDFTLHNRMLNNLGTQEQKVNGTIVRTVVRPRDRISGSKKNPTNADKLLSNEKLRPGIMKFSGSETRFIRSSFRARLFQYIRTTLKVQ